jgi:hypothetical protein
MTAYGLFADPKTDPHNEQKVQFIFDIFYNAVEFEIWKPAKDDKYLRMLLRIKIDRRRAAMIRDGEVMQTNEGLKLWAKPTNKNFSSDTQAKHPQVSTLPATPTPVPPVVQYCEVVETWKGLDVDTQMKLFKELLQTAKDTNKMIFEWEEWRAEVRKKERTDVEKHPTAEENAIPGITPEPSSSSSSPLWSKPLDLKTSIRDRIRELKLKRQLEKNELEREPKKRKGESE